MGFSHASSIPFSPSPFSRLYSSINETRLPSSVTTALLKCPGFRFQFYPGVSFINGDFRAHHLKMISYRRRKPIRNIKSIGIRASSEQNRSPTDNQRIIVGSAVTVVLAVANRVLYKLALVPLKQYPFFLAQVTTFGYVAIYFSILFARYRAGIVTEEMLALPKSRFIAIGILEALGVAAGMSAGAMLPGPAIPILNQFNIMLDSEKVKNYRKLGYDVPPSIIFVTSMELTFLVWQLMLSTLILGRTYSFNQIIGCLLVAAGIVLAVASGSNDSQMFSKIEFIWPALTLASSAFQAGASIIKEFVFIDAASRLKGKQVDIFVVNSFGSGFQALFILLFLPLLSNLKGIPFSQFPSYLKSGAACFLNIGPTTTGCDGAPLLPLLFICVNMAFNISLLNLVKISSAVVSSLSATLAVPIAIYILTLPLPYIPEGTSLSPFFFFGSVILVLGLILYNLPHPAKQGSGNVRR